MVLLYHSFMMSIKRGIGLKPKMTTDMAAKVIGKDRSTIWRYETGQTPITVDVLFKLLHLYEVSVVDVVMVSKGAGENARI